MSGLFVGVVRLVGMALVLLGCLSCGSGREPVVGPTLVVPPSTGTPVLTAPVIVSDVDLFALVTQREGRV